MSIELIQWFKPEDGHVPNTTRDVLVRTNDELYPVWPAFYDVDEWFTPDEMPLGRTVIEWCEMPGGTASQKRVRHTGNGHEYCEVSRALKMKGRDGYWCDAVLYASPTHGKLYVRAVESFDSSAFVQLDTAQATS